MHRDYNEIGTVSYEEVVQVMHKLGINRVENEQFFRRMVFNVMARNQDDHIKNISFLMNRRGEWSLSPAYDITYSFNPNGKWTAVHQMLINWKVTNININDLIQSAHAMHIKESNALTIIDEVRKTLKKWPKFAEEANLGNKTIKSLEKTFLLL